MYDINSLSDLIDSLSNNATISLESTSPDELASLMRLTGFINVIINNNIVTGTKPEYAGDSVKLLSNNNNNGLIDDDDLLDEEDKQKPIITDDCKVKKKACKDCSCGRAEQEQEQQQQQQQEGEQKPKTIKIVNMEIRKSKSVMEQRVNPE